MIVSLYRANRLLEEIRLQPAVLVILAVFIPLLAIGGVAGKLYAPLAVAVGSAMTLSQPSTSL